ncbi:MAG: helix-turn-helix domain-containing protein [Acidobacteria bacterium]|nr:helix-turn-helix domain-containing protein [Acidobacteriota bacterium]
MAEHEILADLGRAVAARRREVGMDQARLAERIGKSASYLSRIEAGLVIPSLETTGDIADALQTDRALWQRLALGAQVVKLAGSHLDLEGLRTALRYLSDDGSPLESAFRR